MSKDVVLTGLRSNAEFHLGNYLGAILSVVELQKKHADQYQINMFIPDLHSFTTPIEHGNLYEQSLKNLKVFVAAGLDIDNPDTFIYRQSYIPAHSELTWVLSCFSSFGELSRMTQFKEKINFTPNELEEIDYLYMQLSIVSSKEIQDRLKAMDVDMTALNTLLGSAGSASGMKVKKEHSPLYQIALDRYRIKKESSLSVGLFSYPVLMAADILLYGAKWVPVGEDQRQHVEFTRDLGMRMNNKFGDLFILPEDNAKQTEFAGRREPVRIRSLRNPEKKMSKSVEDPAGTIMLSDSPDDAAKKVMEATTDSVGAVNYDWDKQPGVTNLLQILALISDKSQDEVNGQWQGKTSYGELKSAVADAVKNFLADFQSKLSQVDEAKLMSKLEDDEKAMTDIANQTLLKVQRAVGLRPSN